MSPKLVLLAGAILAGGSAYPQDRIPLDSITSDSADIAIRSGCYWDRPGIAPWTGDSSKLLAALGLTAEQSQTLLSKIAADEYDSVIQITATGITENRYPFRLFSLNMDMSSGRNVLCLNTRPGRNWQAASYSAKLFVLDNSIYFAIPEICGNISRLTLEQFFYRPVPNGGSFYRPDPSMAMQVSLPSTLFLFLLGLCIAIAKTGEIRSG